MELTKNIKLVKYKEIHSLLCSNDYYYRVIKREKGRQDFEGEVSQSLCKALK